MITFLELGKYGRLGNMMFQVASTIGIAERTRHLTAFPKWDHPFKYDTALVDSRQKFDAIEVPWGYHDIEIGADRNISLHGYLQSEKYFKHCEEGIRNLFTFKHYPRAPHQDFISLHVRRGDYDPRYHTLLDRTYYEKALGMLPDLPVILFSDDMDAAKKVIPWRCICYHSPNAGYDLALMAQAKYHVIANSSFSWWGAWLSNAERVVAPADWFGPSISWDTKDLIPDRWEVI